MLALALLSTYASAPATAALVGVVPPEPIRSARRSPSASTPKSETSSLPALTTSSQRPSSPSTTEFCEGRCGCPVPRPPVS
jgi:hypothetical protein